jgi:hypothetical protein
MLCPCWELDVPVPEPDCGAPLPLVEKLEALDALGDELATAMRSVAGTGTSAAGADAKLEPVRLLSCPETSRGLLPALSVVRGKPFAPYERLVTPDARPEAEPDDEPGKEPVVELDSELLIAPSKFIDGGWM